MNAIAKVEVEQRALSLMQKAKVHILLHHPLYGALIERLKFRCDWRAKTLYTDGRVIGFNPEYICNDTFDDLLFKAVHETSHCAFGHPFRTRAIPKEHRDIWNEACDHAINLLLIRDPRLKMAKGGLCDPKWTGLAAHEIYAALLAARLQKQAEEEAKKKEQQQKEQQKKEQSQEQGESQEQQPGDGPEGQPNGEGKEGEPKEGEAKEGEATPGEVKEEPVGVGSDHGDVIAPGEAGDFDDEEGDSPFAKNDEHQEKEEGSEDEQASPRDQEGDVEAPEDDEGTGEESGEGDGADDAGDVEEDGGGDASEGEGGEEKYEGGKEAEDAARDAELAREWSAALITATIAEGTADSAAFERAVREQTCPKQSFEEHLERFCVQHVQDIEDWSRPNRRFRNVYLPSHGGLGARCFVFGVDTSMSITQEQLNKMQNAMERIAEQARIELSIVVFCDTKVRRVEEYRNVAPKFERAMGGGGTSFEPVFAYAVERMSEGVEVAGVIYLTDQEGHCDHAEDYSHIPTLWVNPGKVQQGYYAAPFGEACSMLS